MAEGIYDMHEMEECTLMMKLQLAKMSVYFCSLFLKCVAATHTHTHTLIRAGFIDCNDLLSCNCNL